ncbi:hypothetical protein [Streptomyces sp. NPDC058583]|uniref:hypothetical protein n=1 Tax=unclassified Streptomyces TaxID=2593676 RepID=UPI003652E516
MQIIDLAEQTRLLGQTPRQLEELRAEIEAVRTGEIRRPVREIAPLSIRAHGLAIQCLRQLDTLSTSQYAVMKEGEENLARLAEATLRISIASSLCAFGITGRTDALLYEDSDETPETSRRHLAEAVTNLGHAAVTYRMLAQRLSRRLASAVARAEDQLRINRGLAGPGVTAPSAPRTTTPTAPQAAGRAAAQR